MRTSRRPFRTQPFRQRYRIARIQNLIVRSDLEVTAMCFDVHAGSYLAVHRSALDTISTKHEMHATTRRALRERLRYATTINQVIPGIQIIDICAHKTAWPAQYPDA